MKVFIGLLVAAAVILFVRNYHKNFNVNHPELREGEIFCTNSSRGDVHHVGWKTKRVGKQAYDIHGNPVGPSDDTRYSYVPVFVKTEEMRQAGFRILLIKFLRIEIFLERPKAFGL